MGFLKDIGLGGLELPSDRKETTYIICSKCGRQHLREEAHYCNVWKKAIENYRESQ